MKKYFVILVLLFAGASYAQPPRIDSMVVPGPDNDTIYIYGKFGIQSGKAFLDTAEMKVYLWTDTIVSAHLPPLFVGNNPSCGPVLVNVNGLVSNTRILDMGVVTGNVFFGGDTLIDHSTNFNNYWRYDLHSFFLNRKGIDTVVVPTNYRNSTYDFLNDNVNFDVGHTLIIPLDKNYYFPNGVNYYYSVYGYEIRYEVIVYCSAPLDARLFFRGFNSVNQTIELPFSFSAFPNPSSKELNIIYSLPSRENVRIILYDLEGNVIRESVNEADGGEHSLKWDTSELPSGSYVLGLVTSLGSKSQIVTIIH